MMLIKRSLIFSRKKDLPIPERFFYGIYPDLCGLLGRLHLSNQADRRKVGEKQ